MDNNISNNNDNSNNIIINIIYLSIAFDCLYCEPLYLVANPALTKSQ